MARIFISHSSSDNKHAIELRDWLIENGWDDIFLDLDPEHGIVAGERWKEALKEAAHRCEAVLALVSPEWLKRDWCRAELASAELLGKKIFVLLIGSKNSDLSSSLKDAQYVDLVSDPDAHKRLKEGLRRAGLDPTSFPFEEGRRPYPGFAPLEEKDAAIFFGRDAQIVRGLDKLRGLVRGGVERVLFILGASGSGKSSFLRAGLLPRLERDDTSWLLLPTIRPERAAITGKFGLVEALHSLVNNDRFRERLDESVPRSRAKIEELVTTRKEEGLATVLEALRQAGRVATGEECTPPTVVIPIDQGEELFNEEGREEDERFIGILASTLERDRRVLVLVTMRTDSFPQVQNHPVLSILPQDTYTLPRMPEGSYRTVIEGPARLVQPPLDIDPQLTEALLEDASGQDALALLAFTLRHLYERHLTNNALTLEGYEKLGRLKGVIEAVVKEAFAEGASRGELPKEKQAQLALIRMAFIPHLARINAAGELVRRVATRTEIPMEARPLIDRFADARLLIKDRRSIGSADEGPDKERSGAEPSAGDVEVIEVAHEALLREWDDLNRAIDEEKDFLKDKAQLERDLADWQEAPGESKSGALLTGNKLVRATEWLIKHPQGIADEERQFIQASVDAETTQRNRELEEARKLAEAQREVADKQRTVARRTRTGLIAASVLALTAIAGAVAAWRAQQTAEFATSRAEGARFSALAQLPDRATEALAGAIRLVSADLRAGKPLAPEAVHGLEDAMRAVGYEVPDKHVLTGHKGDVTSVAWSPDGMRLLTTSEDGTVRLWDSIELTEIASYAWRYRGASQGVTSDAFSRDGKHAVVATREGALVLDTRTGETIATLEGHDDEVLFAAYSDDDSYILTTGNQGKVLMWNAATFEIDKTFAEHGAVLFADLSPDGKYLVSGGQHQTVVIWSVEDQSIAFGGEPVRSNYNDLALGEWIHTGAFVDNRYLIVADERGGGIIWDMRDKRVVRAGYGMSRIDSSSFAKGIAAMGDEVVSLRPNNPPDLKVKLERIGGNRVDFSTLSQDGKYLAAAVTADDVARVYETATGRRVATLEGHEQGAKGAVLSAAFRPRGTQAVATASRDGTVRLWNLLPEPELPEVPDDPDAIDREAIARLLERACSMLRNRSVYDEVRAPCRALR